MINQLILSKRLYVYGSQYADGPDPISAGIAISLFQDSIEILCWSILKQLDAQAKDTTPFTAYFDLVETAPKNKDSNKLPFKAKMLELNKARVNFKHYGILPDISESRKFKGYTEEFLRLSFNIFYDSDFDSISLSQLIPFKDIRDSIESAEKALLDRNVEESIHQLAKAKRQLLSEVDQKLREADRIFKGVGNHSGIHIFRDLSHYLNNLRNMNFIALCGVSIRQYLLIEKALPIAMPTRNGEWHFTFASTSPAPSADDAEKIINIMINLALKLGQLIS